MFESFYFSLSFSRGEFCKSLEQIHHLCKRFTQVNRAVLFEWYTLTSLEGWGIFKLVGLKGSWILIKDCKKEIVLLGSVVSHSGKTHLSVSTGRNPSLKG